MEAAQGRLAPLPPVKPMRARSQRRVRAHPRDGVSRDALFFL
jgi:hypothetical protein